MGSLVLVRRLCDSWLHGTPSNAWSISPADLGCGARGHFIIERPLGS